jgi:carboxymethylenebutenolidase
VRIDLPSGTPAELARPGDSAPVAGLVIAPDIFGLRPLYDEMCQRLADEHALVVCAAEPFPGQDLGPDVEPRFAAVARLDDEAVLRDLREAATATGFPADQVGLIGFCMGGMYALKAAGLGTFPKVVAFYGMIRVPEAWRAPGQGEPLSYLRRPGASPTLAIVGERDHYTPAADVDELWAAGVEVVRYPEAEHGFVHDPARPAHRPDDAADAWRRGFAHLGLG